MMIAIFLLLVLWASPAWGDCILAPIIGNGTDADPYRPSIPVTVKERGKWAAQIPSNPDDGSPKFKDAIVCFPLSVTLPDHIRIPVDKAKGLMLSRDARASVGFVDKIPEPIRQGSFFNYFNRVYRFVGDLLQPALAWAASVSDAFDRADNTDLGASWNDGYTSVDSCQIVGDAVRPTALDNACHETHANSFGANQFAQITIAAFSGTVAQVSVLLRSASPPTLTVYRVVARRGDATSTTKIQKLIAGSTSDVASENSTTWAATDTIYVSNTSFTVKRNGAELLTGTDADIENGRVGLNLLASDALGDAQGDDFIAGDLHRPQVRVIVVE